MYGRLYTNYETQICKVDTFVKNSSCGVLSKGGEVIVPASGETAEDIAVASHVSLPGILLGGDLNVVTPKDNLDSNFLALFITFGNAHVELSKRAQGKSVVHVRNGDLSQLNIKYPTQSEQILISNLFIKNDNLITLHQRKLDALKKIKSALLEKMFPKDGSDIPEIRFTGFTEAWEQRKVFEIANRLDNLRVPVASNLRIPGNTPYYGANGIQDYVSGFTHNGEFVLVAEDGANDLKNYPVQYVSGKIWVNNHAHVLQGLERVIDNRFLSFSLVHCDIEVLLVGGGRSKLNANTLMNELTLSLPNLNEQKNIGGLFFKLDNLITLHQREHF